MQAYRKDTIDPLSLSRQPDNRLETDRFGGAEDVESHGHALAYHTRDNPGEYLDSFLGDDP